jgi:hypothetical protein
MERNEEEAVVIDPARRMRLATGRRHVLRLPADYMTISFLVDSAAGIELAYPKYELRSADGAYEKTMSAKDDLVPGDAYMQLKFDELLPGKRYTLRRLDGPTMSRVVFQGVAYENLVDRPRKMHDHLRTHGYVGFSSMRCGSKPKPEWSSDDDEAV